MLRALRGAIDAMQTQDVELCDEVIMYDDEIDMRYHRIEKSIEEILAQQSPVATDLRLVLAVLHSSIHLERVGDQSVTVAKLTKLTADLEPRHDLVDRSARDGRASGGDGARLARCFQGTRHREGSRARRSRRADRPDEPQGRRPRAELWRRARRSRSGVCGWSWWRAASSESETTRSTSASRSSSS